MTNDTKVQATHASPVLLTMARHPSNTPLERQRLEAVASHVGAIGDPREELQTGAEVATDAGWPELGAALALASRAYEPVPANLVDSVGAELQELANLATKASRAASWGRAPIAREYGLICQATAALAELAARARVEPFDMDKPAELLALAEGLEGLATQLQGHARGLAREAGELRDIAAGLAGQWAPPVPR